MLSTRHHLAEQYFKGHFAYPSATPGIITPDRFDAVQAQFDLKHDDFYHDYFKAYGKAEDANKALVRINYTLFSEAYGHLPKAYKNCAISSGTMAHIDAVSDGHYTTDRLSRIVGADWHTKTIKDNSQRSLERIALIKDLFPEVFFVAPVMYEGSQRAFSKGQGRQITSLPAQAEVYMAFWNMVIDTCEAFVLDDVALDMPSIEMVEQEMDLAKSWSKKSRTRPILQTSDWANSRNSILEVARAVYIKFGMHPIRPDAKMDLRLYDQASHGLYRARLIDVVKPILQNILRWTPQGIATDTACTTAARLFDLHRMRTDSVYNRLQVAPLELSKIDVGFAKPTVQEEKEFNLLMEKFEPFLLGYVPHLIKTDGLPIDYAHAQQRHGIQPHEIKERAVRWQRENIPKQVALDLWQLTLPDDFAKRKPCRVPSISHGTYIPQRRQHDFENHAFAVADDEMWQDKPFEHLDPMFKQLAQAHIGVLEIVAQNADKPEYRGIRYDLKRGEHALAAAAKVGLADLSLLPGAMGKEFNALVKDPTFADAMERLENARKLVLKNGKEKQVPAFGAPVIAVVNDTIRQERKYFNGPGPSTPPSDYRIALDMEMLRRNYTSYEFQKNWETSEDGARMMMMATKIEFGLVDRPGKNLTELKVVDEDGKYISFADRVDHLYRYLSILKQDPRIKRAVAERDAEAIESYGVRHISLTLARMLEIYDGLKDQEYNNGRFEIRRVENLREFSADIDSIAKIKDIAREEIEKEWCWLWPFKDLTGLRSDYANAWVSAHGRQGQIAGANPVYDQGIQNKFG